MQRFPKFRLYNKLDLFETYQPFIFKSLTSFVLWSTRFRRQLINWELLFKFSPNAMISWLYTQPVGRLEWAKHSSSIFTRIKNNSEIVTLSELEAIRDLSRDEITTRKYLHSKNVKKLYPQSFTKQIEHNKFSCLHFLMANKMAFCK